MASSRSENLVILIGNLTRDPNLRYTANGAAVADFGIATNRVWTTPEGETKEEVEFHQVVAWNKLAEICQQILSKGDKVYIRGSLRTRSWEDDNGTKHYRTEVKVEDMKLLYSKSGRGSSDDDTSKSDDSDDFDLDALEEELEESEDKGKKKDSKGKKAEKEDKKSAKKSKKKSVDEVDLEADDLPF